MFYALKKRNYTVAKNGLILGSIMTIVPLFIIFVIPEMTYVTLEKSFPEFSGDEQQALDILMKYAGPNNSGLTVLEVLETKISEEYPQEKIKILEHRETYVDVIITNLNPEEYKVNLNFISYKGEMNYDWNVNMVSEKITPNNPEAKYIIDLVDYYD